MKHDGFAFPAPDIRENTHSPRVAYTVPKTVSETEATAWMLNAESGDGDFVNSTDSGASE